MSLLACKERLWRTVESHNTRQLATEETGTSGPLKADLEKMEPKQRVEILSFAENSRKCRTVLHFICMDDQIENCKAVLDAVAEEDRVRLLTHKDGNEYTPLHAAAEYAKQELVSALLTCLPESRWLDIFKQQGFDKRTPLHCAALNNKDDTVMQILLQFLKKIDGGEKGNSFQPHFTV